MTKTTTNTGLIKFVCHDQVWFERPGYEVIFTRINIEHSYEFSQEGTIVREDISRIKRDG